MNQLNLICPEGNINKKFEGSGDLILDSGWSIPDA
jgi:hypothetical protein